MPRRMDIRHQIAYMKRPSDSTAVFSVPVFACLSMDDGISIALLRLSSFWPAMCVVKPNLILGKDCDLFLGRDCNLLFQGLEIQSKSIRNPHVFLANKEARPGVMFFVPPGRTTCTGPKDICKSRRPDQHRSPPCSGSRCTKHSQCYNNCLLQFCIYHPRERNWCIVCPMSGPGIGMRTSKIGFWLHIGRRYLQLREPSRAVHLLH